LADVGDGTIDRLEHGRGMISVVATRSYNHWLVVGCGRTATGLATFGGGDMSLEEFVA